MPLYEYQCPKCGRFEVIRKFSDEPLTTCPTCGAEVQKMPSAPAIQFKGTGWYITDYARKGGGKGESKDAGGTDAGKGEGKAEPAGDGGKKDAGPSATPAPASSGAKDSGSSGSGSSGSST